jgi:signal transduction histidine kinase
MKLGIKLRLAALALAVALMGTLIVLATLRSQRQSGELRIRLKSVDSESFGMANYFKDSLRELNNQIFQYAINHDTAVWDEFRKASDALDRWIDEQKSRLTTQREKDIVQRIDAEYDVYRRVANELRGKLQSFGQRKASLEDLASFRAESQRLFDLGQALAKAHYDSRNLLLARANHTLTQFRWLVVGSLGLLFLFGVALAAMVYREMIAPLRVKLVASQALIERNEKLASLGMLAAGVAHEIRNPLTAIKAALFIQQKKFQPGSEEYSDTKLVEREILRLERIVNDFLQFARPTEPEFTIIQGDMLLQEVQKLLAPQLAKNNIQLIVEDSPPARIKADAAQIKQVLINLVQNAADSISQNGTVKLRARQDRKHISYTDTNVVILEVSDSGKGIPPEVEKRLFDPFFTTKDNGTGLGLSIAAGIVRKHGGSLQYQTQVHRGSVFGIVLPQVTA